MPDYDMTDGVGIMCVLLFVYKDYGLKTASSTLVLLLRKRQQSLPILWAWRRKNVFASGQWSWSKAAVVVRPLYMCIMTYLLGAFIGS